MCMRGVHSLGGPITDAILQTKATKIAQEMRLAGREVSDQVSFGKQWVTAFKRRNAHKLHGEAASAPLDQVLLGQLRTQEAVVPGGEPTTPETAQELLECDADDETVRRVETFADYQAVIGNRNDPEETLEDAEEPEAEYDPPPDRKSVV